jgi:hypothetical protein
MLSEQGIHFLSVRETPVKPTKHAGVSCCLRPFCAASVAPRYSPCKCENSKIRARRSMENSGAGLFSIRPAPAFAGVIMVPVAHVLAGVWGARAFLLGGEAAYFFPEALNSTP